MTAAAGAKKYPIPDSYIKNVAIRLPDDFQLINAPYPIETKDQERRNFLGCSENLAKFLGFLQAGFGVFLVTGYRGMGKTSFVNKVIHDYKAAQQPDRDGSMKKFLDIHLTLAQNSPKEIDILRLLTSSAYDRFTAVREEQYQVKQQEQDDHQSMARLTHLFVVALLLINIPALLIIKPLWFTAALTNSVGIPIPAQEAVALFRFVSYFLFGLALAFVFYYLYHLSALSYRSKMRGITNYSAAYERLKTLNERCYAAMTQENNQGESFVMPGSFPFFTKTRDLKKMKQSPVATVKELEFELRQFLAEADKDQFSFIFVFDELDKIEPLAGNNSLYDRVDEAVQSRAELSYQLDLRHRKEAVINVIAGLKNFFTTASAQFIFIAGREMFDASLADISDRQSSVSSIFTYTFNIESLFKSNEPGDSNSRNSSLSHSIEQHVNLLLFGKDNPGQQSFYQRINSSFQVCSCRSIPGVVDVELCTVQTQEEYLKLYFTLQNFVTYLTYRSNGSPKKMLRAIHELVVLKEISDFGKNLVYVNTEQGQVMGGKCYYLYFDYYTQYKIGFLSYLFRPFLIQYGRSFKLYSDNINVSTAYLFDHLIKYHPFAFSLTNLELIPEILSANKTPAIREHVKQIIQHLSANHLRETEISLFDYKFYSRTNNEITFLSKISEQEAAAFNFTLDESHMVKLHMTSKIHELRKTYAPYVGSDKGGQIPQIYSIAHINGILGDLHFFDQEYDDAILAYADANRPINHLRMRRMNMRDFFTLIKNKLKQGLCFEKMGAFVDALAFYNDSCEDVLNYMNHKISDAYFGSEENNTLQGGGNAPAQQQQEQSAKREKDITFINSSLNDALELIVQCFLAKIIVQEKMGLDGLTGPKVIIDLGSFLSIVERISRISSKSALIAGQVFLMTGKLLYYKNSGRGFTGQEKFLGHLPSRIAVNLKNLVEKYGRAAAGTFLPRQPLLALYLYVLGLNEVVSARSPSGDGSAVQQDFFAAVHAHENIAHGILLQLEYLLTDPQHLRYTGIHFGQIGAFLSNIGDCLLAKLRVETADVSGQQKTYRPVNSSRIEEIFKLEGYDAADANLASPFVEFTTRLVQSKAGSSQIADVIRCYYLAGQYQLKYGRSHSCSFQYRKILWVLRLVLDFKENTGSNQVFIDFLQHTIIKPALRLTSQNAEHTGYHMRNKARAYGLQDKNVLNNVSNHPETREIILLINYIRIKVGLDVQRSTPNLISSYNSFSSQYARILELDFHAKQCFNKLQLQTAAGQRNWVPADVETACSYLFNMHSILKILKIYGTDFIAGHSYYAYTHYRIASFVFKIHDHKLEDGVTNLRDYLRDFINYISEETSYTITDFGYHYHMAAEMYRRTIQLHTAGKEYEKSLTEMIYLEDDFNDNAYHFGAAIERYMMINGVFENSLKQCEARTSADAYFDPDTYR